MTASTAKHVVYAKNYYKLHSRQFEVNQDAHPLRSLSLVAILHYTFKVLRGQRTGHRTALVR